MIFYFYLRIINFILFFNMITSSTAQQESHLSLNRVVYQTFVLSEGSVQCYGTCIKDIEDPTNEIVLIKSCEWNKLRLSCPHQSEKIRIQSAIVGRLSAEQDVCKAQSLLCSRNITGEVAKLCGKSNTCIYKIPEAYFEEKCEIVKYLSIDVRFYCGNFTQTTGSTTMPGESDSTLSPSSSPIMVTIPWIQHTIQTDPPSPPPSSPAVLLNDQLHHRDSKFFWLLTAYSWMTDKDFMTKNKAHMALAIILSVFVGLVVSLFFILDHSRRTKRKKLLEIEEHEDENQNESANTLPKKNTVTLNNGHALELRPLIKTKPLNGCLKKPKEPPNQVIKISTESDSDVSDDDDDDDDDDYDHNRLITRCKDNSENEMFIKSEQIFDTSTMEQCDSVDCASRSRYTTPPISLTNLPPPPKELLPESHSTSSSPGELIPPPWEFVSGGNKENPTYSNKENIDIPSDSSENKSFPMFVVTNPTPRNSSVFINEDETKNKTMTRPCLKQSTSSNHNPNLTSEKKVRYPSCIMSSYSDTCDTPHRRVSLDQNNDFILASQMDMLVHRSMSNGHISKMSNAGLARPKRNESPLFQTYSDNQDINNTGKTINRNLRKGRLHVIATNKTNFEPAASTKTNFGTAISTLPMIDYVNEENQVLDLMEDEEECDSDKTTIDHHHIDCDKEKLVSIEESGYQSRETGTDSLCSSNRSTDYEDFHCFSPSNLPAGILKNNGRTKSCRSRERNSKRDTADVANVKVLTKVARRMRYENTRTQIDLRPSESSMEDTSSRDSISVPRTRLKSKRREVAVTAQQSISDCNRRLNNDNVAMMKNNQRCFSDADVDRRMMTSSVHLNGNILTE